MNVFPYTHFSAMKDIRDQINWMKTQEDPNEYYKQGIEKEQRIYKEVLKQGLQVAA